MFLLSKNITSVEKISLNFGSKTLTLLAAPSSYIHYDNMYEEPLLIELPKNLHDLMCIQHDPMHTMARFRHLGDKLTTEYPQVTQPKAAFEFEIPTVQKWQECQASFVIHQYQCDEVKDNQEYIKNIQKNVVGRDFLRYPYINSTLIMSILHEEHPVLIDIPEQLLRINVANSLKLTELRDMYQAIISGLKEYYAHEYDDYISGYEITYELYPDIFQIQRDLFTISFLQHLARENNILAVISAPTFVAIQQYWNQPFTFNNYNKCIPMMNEDNEDQLIEKHAILDCIMNTQTWNDKYLKNRFVYIDKSENIDIERKKKLKGKFFNYYQKYNVEMSKIMDPIMIKASSLDYNS